MEGRMRKYGHTSPERISKVWSEPPPKYHQQQQGRKIPVVYYLCRNRHLEHPHFIEVPTSSPEGLYLRDVINRLNVLRGKGMAAMYSWSCKRSYKNGFVWHDLSEDDLILPTHGNEYVLKGSELLDASPPDRLHQTTSNTRSQNPTRPQQQEPIFPSRSQEASPSSSSIVIREAKRPPQLAHPPSPPPPPPPPLPQEDELSPMLHRPSSSSGYVSPESKLNPSWGGGQGSPGLAEYRVYKAKGAADASTQTEERGGTRRARAVRDTRTRGVSTDEASLDLEFEQTRRSRTPRSKQSSEISRDEISPPPTSSSASSSGGKTETLESLIRADARKLNSFRILEEEEVLVPTAAKFKATNLLMQLITCGSISVKDHHSFGLITTYKPRFSHVKFPSPPQPMFSSSMMLGEMDCLSENPRLMGLRSEEKEYFSGSFIETNQHKVEGGELAPTLKRSSSYNADRSCKSPDTTTDTDRVVDTSRSKCLPRTIKITSGKLSKNGTMRSPILDGPRISSARLDCSQSTSLGSSKGGSKRITDASSVKGSLVRLESFNEEKEKLIKIEERLTSGARVIIQSRAPCDDDSEDSSSS